MPTTTRLNSLLSEDLMDEQQREVNSCLKVVSSTGLVQRPFGQLLEEFLSTGFRDKAELVFGLLKCAYSLITYVLETSCSPSAIRLRGVGHHLRVP